MSMDTSDGDPVKDEISRYEDERLEATRSCNIARLDQLLGDALIYIHSSAIADDKAAYLASLRSGELRYHVFEREGVRVVPLGQDAALVSGRIRIQLTLHGEHKRPDNLFVDVWVRRAEGWRMVSWQSTPIPATQPDSGEMPGFGVSN
jgi:hypothetical protein